MQKYFLTLFTIINILTANISFASDNKPLIITSIPPVYYLVKDIASDKYNVELLLSGSNSAHDLHLKPSQITAMNEADMIFYISDKLESFISRVKENLKNTNNLYELSSSAGVKLSLARSGGIWEEHQHQHHTNEQEQSQAKTTEDEYRHSHINNQAEMHRNIDMHFWLDPENAVKMANFIANKLSENQPQHKNLFTSNAKSLEMSIMLTAKNISQQLNAKKEKPFIVFHDAFAYFERYFGLNGAGAIVIEPEQPISANRIHDIRTKIMDSNIACILNEPQFSRKLTNSIKEGLNVNIATANPLFITTEVEQKAIKEGKKLYPILLQEIASSLSQCL